MDFLFHVPFFCTAAAAAAATFESLLVNILWAQKADFEHSSHFVK
jgi:hypothetical protein